MQENAPHRRLQRAASTLLNGILGLDPATRQRLKALEGRCLELHCTTPELQLAVSVHEGRIVLTGVPPQSAASTEDISRVRGPLSEFLALQLARDKGAQLVNGALTISGDSSLLLELQELFEHQQPDWEAAVARLSGDIPARLLGGAARRMLSWRRLLHKSLSRNLHRYLSEERGLLASRHQWHMLRKELQRSTDTAQHTSPGHSRRTESASADNSAALPDYLSDYPPPSARPSHR